MLSAKFQGLVCNEIHRILREISKTAPGSDKSTGNMSSPSDSLRTEFGHRRVPSEFDSYPSVSMPMVRSLSRPKQIPDTEELLTKGKQSRAVSFDMCRNIIHVG